MVGREGGALALGESMRARFTHPPCKRISPMLLFTHDQYRLHSQPFIDLHALRGWLQKPLLVTTGTVSEGHLPVALHPVFNQSRVETVDQS